MKRIPPIDRLRRIRDRWQNEVVCGIRVDALTADVMIKLYDQLGADDKQKFEGLLDQGKIGLVYLAQETWKRTKFVTA